MRASIYMSLISCPKHSHVYIQKMAHILTCSIATSYTYSVYFHITVYVCMCVGYCLETENFFLTGYGMNVDDYRVA